jgi:phage terminase small subunit
METIIMQNTLTPTQELFAQQVVLGKTQAEAYRLAHPKAKSWKDEAAHVEASKLANSPKVLLRIQELQRELWERDTATRERTIAEISRIALSDIRKLFNVDGTLKRVDELPEEVAAALAQIEYNDDGQVRKVKLWDKNAALEKLCKILGLFEKDNRQRSDPLTELLGALSGNVMGVKDAGNI